MTQHSMRVHTDPPLPPLEEYVCPQSGCGHTEWFLTVPNCPRHRVRMVLRRQVQS